MPITVRCSQARAPGPPPPSPLHRPRFQRVFRPRMSPAIQPSATPPPPLSSGYYDGLWPVQRSPPSPVTQSGTRLTYRPLHRLPMVPTGPPVMASTVPLRFRLPPGVWDQNLRHQPRMSAPEFPTPVPLADVPVSPTEAPIPESQAPFDEPCIVQLNPYYEAHEVEIENVPPQPPASSATSQAPTGRRGAAYVRCELCDSKEDPSRCFESTGARQVFDHWESTMHKSRFATFASRGHSTRDGADCQDRLLNRMRATATPIRENPAYDGDNIIWEFQCDNGAGTSVSCEVTVERSFTDGVCFDPDQPGPSVLWRGDIPEYQQISTTRIPGDDQMRHEKEVYLEFKFNVTQPKSRDELEVCAVEGLTKNQLNRLQKRAEKSNDVRLGTYARIRVQQVGDPNPMIYYFDLPTRSELRSEEAIRAIPLFAPFVGTDLCLIEVVLFTDNGKGQQTSESKYHFFYHDVTHPLLLAAEDHIRQIQRQPESVGFYPSEQPTSVESEGGKRDEVVLTKKHNHFRAACAQRVGEAIRASQERRRTGQKSANFRSSKGTKTRHHYLMDPAATHRPCGPACACRKETDVTHVPVHDLMNPYRKFQQQEFVYMCQRDLALSKFAYDILDHLPLRGARIVPTQNDQVANHGVNTPDSPADGDAGYEDCDDSPDHPVDGPIVILELPDDSLVELLGHEGVRIGAFAEEVGRLQSGQAPSTHYVLQVQKVDEVDGRILVTALAPKDMPPPGELRTFTVLPDSKVLAAALSIVNLASYVPPEPGSGPKRARRNLGPDDLGMDGLDESDDEEAKEDSYTQKKKMTIRDQLWYWCEHLWNPEKAPRIPVASGQFPRLNPEQSVVTQAIAETDAPVYLLWGPPGTGKTTTLGAGVAQYVTEGGKKAIVMAPTNTAADAVAKSIRTQLSHLGSESEMVRIYGSRYSRELIPEELEDSYYQWGRGTATDPAIPAKAALKDAKIVVCTLDTATLRYSAIYDACGIFDLAAFDEAGRIGIANAFVPLTLARRAIFCGDHKQMRPFFNQELQGLADFHWDVSMLQLLIDLDHPWKQLIVNYRSVRRILRPSNRVLYADNPLEAGLHEERNSEAADVIARHPWILRYFPTGPGLSVVPVRGEGKEMFGGSSFGNLAEAFYVATFIINAWTSGLATEGDKNVVGVVSFYRAQQDIIDKLLTAYQTFNPEFQRGPWLTMMSAEKFQGLEADWVLITGCRGNAGDSYEKGDKDLGFLGQLERVNVGLTRARLGVAAFMRPPRYVRNRLWSEFIRAVAEHGDYSFSKVGGRDPLEARMCLCNIMDDKDETSKFGSGSLIDPEVKKSFSLPPVYFRLKPDMLPMVTPAQGLPCSPPLRRSLE